MIVIKKTMISLLMALCCTGALKAQITHKKDTLYIYEESPIINADYEGKLHYFITFKSQESTFNVDSYKFIIPNKAEFDKRISLNKLGKVIALETLEYIEKTKLSVIKPCELHNFFSIKKKIYLVRKKIIKNHSDNSGNKVNFMIYPLLYKGTEKDTELLKLD